LQTYFVEDISLQTIIDQGLVHAVYGSMEEILHSGLGIAIKETCKKLYHLKGRFKIMFYSLPPRFTPPLRPTTHDVYINKGCYHFLRNTYYDLGQEYEELLSKDTNHDNWRIFNAKELEEKKSDLILHVIWFSRKENHEGFSAKTPWKFWPNYKMCEKIDKARLW